MSLDVELVLAVTGALVLLSGIEVGFRPRSRELGVAAGAVILAVGLAVMGFLSPQSVPVLQLDAVSVPRIAVAGLCTMAIFAVMPERHATSGSTLAIVGMVLAHLALAVVPGGPALAVTWALATACTGLALPGGPARRLALPYLILSGGAGAIGVMMGGSAGQGLLVLAVVVRLGVFPFHSWIVGAYQLAPTTVAVAVAAPMSAIALIARTPMGFETQVTLGATVALAGAAVLTAALSIVQRELGRATGMLTVSVASIVLLGVLDADELGHLGGLVMWSVTGASLVGLGLVVAALRSRLGPVPIDECRGLVERTPRLALLFVVFGLAAVGAPGTADFTSEDLMLHGSLAHHGRLLLLVLAAVSVQAFAVLHLFFHTFYGPPSNAPVADALPRERVALVMLAALLLVTGLAPQPLLDQWLAPDGDGPPAVAELR